MNNILLFCFIATAKMTEEEWRVIEEYPDYKVSNLGRVKSCKFNKEKILKPRDSYGGYLCVNLCNQEGTKNIRVHRLVAKTFLDNPEKKVEVDHIDRIRVNNCLINLRWVTHSENMQNKRLCGTNTGESYISYEKSNNRFQLKKVINNIRIDKYFHTLEEAIVYRDILLS